MKGCLTEPKKILPLWKFMIWYSCDLASRNLGTMRDLMDMYWYWYFYIHLWSEADVDYEIYKTWYLYKKVLKLLISSWVILGHIIFFKNVSTMKTQKSDHVVS